MDNFIKFLMVQIVKLMNFRDVALKLSFLENIKVLQTK